MSAKNDKQGRGGYALLVAVVIIALLALSIPIQYLVRRDVVVGLSSEYAHSHAHEEEAEAEHEHEHEHEGEDHYAVEVPLDTNLIANYSFEVGTYGQIWGWSELEEMQVSRLYRDGSLSRRGLASAAVDTAGAEVSNTGWIMRLDELPLDHRVVFEGYIRTQALHGGAHLVVIANRSVEGEDIPETLALASSEEATGDSDWALLDVQLFIPAETTDVWLAVLVSGSGKAWFDDLSLKVYEPIE